MSELDAAWAELDAEAAHTAGSGFLVRRVFPDSLPDIRVALEQPGSGRLLLVGIPHSALRPDALELGSAGIEARVYSPINREVGVVDVGICLRDATFKDLFSALADDLAKHLRVVQSIGDVPPALFGRLLRWHQFLKRLTPNGLGPEQQRGLYGELLFLSRHLATKVGLLRAVNCWAGPKGADQDFQLGPVAVEVKTAAGHQLQLLYVNSERQLDKQGLSDLLIYFASLDVRSETGERLPEIVTAIRDACNANPLARGVFDSCLLEAGYLDAHVPRYSRTGYSLRREAFFQVREGFPCIVESDLSRGVGGVRYTVSVAECDHFEISTDEALAMLRPIADD